MISIQQGKSPDWRNRKAAILFPGKADKPFRRVMILWLAAVMDKEMEKVGLNPVEHIKQA